MCNIELMEFFLSFIHDFCSLFSPFKTLIILLFAIPIETRVSNSRVSNQTILYVLLDYYILLKHEQNRLSVRFEVRNKKKNKKIKRINKTSETKVELKANFC